MTDHTTNPDLTLKRCTKCGELKPATSEYFARRKDCRDGLGPQCKMCRAAYARDWRAKNPDRAREYRLTYDVANRERILEQQRVRRAANRDRYNARQRAYYAVNLEKMRERQRRYIAANRAHVNGLQRGYYNANPERRRKSERLWRIANREKKMAIERNRYARKLAAEGTHTATDIEHRYEAQNGKCYWCSRKLGKKYHVDHVIPLIRGGSNGPENLVIACRRCNLSKKDKLPTEWDGNKTGRML